MRDESIRPPFVQHGNSNTQHNYYGPSSEMSDHGLSGFDKASTSQHFNLVVRLATASDQATLTNAVSEDMHRRAAESSSPIDDLLLCRRLASVIANHGDWRLRRAFSHSLTYFLNSVSSSEEVVDHISRDLLDYARMSPKFGVMLSIASSATIPAALSLGECIMQISSNREPLARAAWLCQANARVYGSTTVGCAVIDERGKIHSGCNVEHRFRSHDIHAETNALGSMVADGGKAAVAVFVVSPLGWTPCGSCLDWIFELGGKDCEIYTQSTMDSPIMTYRAADLMPHFPK